MKLIEVSNRHQRKEFLDIVDVVYRDDPYYVRPLDREVEAIFDPAKNSFFTHGEACRWLLINDEDKVIGRVAAFINRRKAFTYQQPTGGMGFFECIRDRDAAFMLFDQCRIWLSERGMLAMDGPINFGENDINWGLLVEGFVHPGFGMNYNPPWYRDFFESYGFHFYFEQVSNHLDLTKKFPERFWKIAEWVMKKPEITFHHFTFDHKDQYIHDMKEVYDDAWKFHENFTPMDESTLLRSLEKSRSFMDPEMIWFAYYNGEPAAFLIQFPDVNQLIKPLHGKLHLWNQLKFIYLRNKKRMTRSRIVIMGVKPKFQRYGLESGIFWHLNEKMKKKPWYKEIELSWVGDFNPKMRALHESVGATFAKRHITYRKLFSDEMAFQRSSVIPVDTKEKALRNETPSAE